MDARMDDSTSRLTLQNETTSIAMLVVSRGDLMIERLPGLAPGAMRQIPTTQTRTVVATTVLEGNTYTSAPISFTGAMRFLARVVQQQAQGTYAFELVAMPSSDPAQLQFETTTISPVTFQVAANGMHLQSMVVANDFTVQTLLIGDTYSIYAVINGVTTDTVTIHDPNAVIAVVEESDESYAIEIR